MDSTPLLVGYWILCEVFIFLGLNFLGCGKGRPITCIDYFTGSLQSLNKMIIIFCFIDLMASVKVFYDMPSLLRIY